MKKFLCAISLLCATVSLSAQNQLVFDENAEVRQLNQAFSAITIGGGIDLYLSQSDEPAVAVSASDAKYNSNIKTVLDGNTLRVYYEGDKRWSRNRKLIVYVATKNLDKLEAMGASDIKVAGVLRTNALQLTLSGASEFQGTIAVEKLELQLSGASDANIAGSVGILHVESSGASDVDGYDLVSENCTVKASGASDINLTVKKTLNAHASGASHIFYKGSPKVEAAETQGASNISRK